MTSANVLAAITSEPGFRGILVVAVGVLVLMGSVYLLLATNTGPPRLPPHPHRPHGLDDDHGPGLGARHRQAGPAATWNVQDLNYDDLTQTEVVVAGSPEPDQLPTENRSSKATKLAEQFPETEGVKRPASATCWASTPSSRSS